MLWTRPQILNMTMEHIKMITFKMFATTFFTLWPPQDSPMSLAIDSFTTCMMEKRKPTTYHPNIFSHASRKAMQAVNLLDCCHEKELDDEKAKILFFCSFPLNHIRYYIGHSQENFRVSLISIPLKSSMLVRIKTKPLHQQILNHQS